MSYENIIVETKGRVGIIRFNRPNALNALNAALVSELIAAIDVLEADTNVGCLLIRFDQRSAGHLIVFIGLNQSHALRASSRLADMSGLQANQLALLSDDHDF